MLKKILLLAVFLVAMMIIPTKTDAMKLVTSCGTEHHFDFPKGTTMKEVVDLLKHLDRVFCKPSDEFQKRTAEDLPRL